VIGPEGEMLGVFSVPQAIQRAKDFGLDLIEIAPTAKPPTCKIMDYGKWKYENKKKANQARKNQVIVEIKEVQVRPRTDQHDLETKIRHARRFLLEGDKVKVNLRFSGREMAHQEEGMAVLAKFREALADLAIVEADPKKEGRQVFTILAPDPLKVKEYLKTHKVTQEKPEKSEA
jgi:translation initiation factor IF-3